VRTGGRSWCFGLSIQHGKPAADPGVALVWTLGRVLGRQERFSDSDPAQRLLQPLGRALQIAVKPAHDGGIGEMPGLLQLQDVAERLYLFGI
jgi:hypothetical protein